MFFMEFEGVTRKVVVNFASVAYSMELEGGWTKVYFRGTENAVKIMVSHEDFLEHAKAAQNSQQFTIRPDEFGRR